MKKILIKTFSTILTRSFKPFTFTSEYQKKINYDDQINLGLYVHIPFCEKICSFCPYCKMKFSEKSLTEYIPALLKEIDLVCSNHPKKDVSSLYFGGGTPSLAIEYLEEIINKLKNYFNILGDIGIELHPRDINIPLLKRLKEIGFTMISIGIQSFDLNCLASLGRDKDETVKIHERVKASLSEIKFKTVDMDLIFAVPKQTKETLVKDIETAFEYGATQISTYPFIDFTFANNEYKPMNKKTKKQLLNVIIDYTKEHNLERTSVWTFGKKDTQKYSSITRDNYLGFGMSSVTLLKESFKVNTFSLKEYINRINSNELPTALTINFKPRQRMVYYLFWKTYGTRISKEDFKEFFGVSLKKKYGFELFIAKILGYVKETTAEFILTKKGAYLFHLVEQAYTTAYIDKMWHMLRVIPFPDSMKL